jgi:hypothetical protein
MPLMAFGATIMMCPEIRGSMAAATNVDAGDELMRQMA